MKKELLNYLKSVQSLESDLYAYECSKEEIQKRINDTKYEIECIEEPQLSLPSEPQKTYVEDLENRILRIKRNSMFYRRWVHKSGLFWGILGLVFCSVIVCVLSMATIAEGSLDDEERTIATVFSFVLTIILGYLPARWIGIAKLKNEDINCAKKSFDEEILCANNEYYKAYNEYQSECRKIEKIFNDQKAENEQKKQDLSDRVVSLQNSLENIEMNMAELREKIEQAYSVDIIYPKYRGLVSISMFVEYFETGRCDALTGHEGAYNLYESELRQNLIISSLKNITNKMDDMKQRQYRLYSAIKDANRISGEISKHAIESAKQNKLAADNAAITALHTKSLAESTKLIADIEAERLDELKKFLDID